MYCCLDCGKEFEYVEVVFEKHGLDSPPYERIKLCPFCHSPNYEEKQNCYCGWCGVKLSTEGKYCSERCRKTGLAYRERQRQNAERFRSSPVAKAVREVAEYNKAHNTRLSYGQYFSKGEGRLE